MIRVESEPGRPSSRAEVGALAASYFALASVLSVFLARNLASDAVNRPLDITGLAALVHPNTVHDAGIICNALYAVAHHRGPPLNLTCTTLNRVPLIPSSP